MGSDGFDDRITSRMSGGIVIGIESPSYEMKLNLIHVFCDRAFKERNSSLFCRRFARGHPSLRTADKAGQSEAAHEKRRIYLTVTRHGRR